MGAKRLPSVPKELLNIPKACIWFAKGISKVPNGILMVPLEFGRASNSLPSSRLGGSKTSNTFMSYKLAWGSGDRTVRV
jgi:hypothetical protein